MRDITVKITVAASVAAMLALWELASLRIGSSQIMPGPWETLCAVGRLFGERGFLLVVGSTLLRGVAGFMIASALGIVLGIIGGLHENFETFMKPWIVVMRSTPVVAFILLALIWFSQSTAVFIGIITMFPMVFTNIVEGIRNVDGDLVAMARFYKVRQRDIIMKVYFPAILPYMISGVSSASGIGWRAIIIGEVLSQPRYGIGSSMQLAQMQMNVDTLIAWTLVAVIIGFAFEMIIRLIEKKLLKGK
ncbi:MAG: ABC transporter permease [Candidatus Limimorpha sp.]